MINMDINIRCQILIALWIILNNISVYALDAYIYDLVNKVKK